MTSDKGNPNGSADLLAQAMRRVFREEVEGAVETQRADMEDIETRPEDHQSTKADRAGLDPADESGDVLR